MIIAWDLSKIGYCTPALELFLIYLDSVKAFDPHFFLTVKSSQTLKKMRDIKPKNSKENLLTLLMTDLSIIFELKSTKKISKQTIVAVNFLDDIWNGM